MKLSILSVQQDLFGTYEITAQINGKEYVYRLDSKYAYDKAMRDFRAGRHGRCLAILNKHKGIA